MNTKTSNHSWLINMLLEMSEYAELNGLHEVSAALSVAKTSTALAITDYEQKIDQSKHAAFTRMMQ